MVSYFAITTIILGLICFALAFRLFFRSQFVFAVLLLILGGIFLRLYISSDAFLHDWDERYHALVAKNMMHHPFKPTLYENPVLPYDYFNWTANHVWLHKQPLPLWCMAVSMKLFGVNEYAVRLPSFLFSLIGIWLIYCIGRHLFSERVGFLAAFFFAANGLIIEIASGRIATDHIDISFLFFVLLGVYYTYRFCEKGKVIYNVLAGASVGAAILCKWLPALIVIPVWVLLVSDARKLNLRQFILPILILLVSCVVVFLPWQIYIYNYFPDEAAWEAASNFKHITQVLDDQGGPWYYYLDHIRINYGELVYLPLLWFMWRWMKDLRNKRLMALVVWFWVPVLFFSFVQTKMQGYILFASPVLFMLTAKFCDTLLEKKSDTKYNWALYTLFVVIMILPIRYVIERIKPWEDRSKNEISATELKRLNKKYPDGAVLFGCDKPIEAMFYANVIAYPQVLEKSILDSIAANGVSVHVIDSTVNKNHIENQ